MNQNFQSLAKFLDSFEGKKSKSLSKAEKMSRFLSLPLNRNYPLIRLLMPKEDSRVYNIKQSKVAKIYISILGITESMDDAKNLILFSDPTKATNRKTIGDLGLTILEILNSRIGSSRADHSTLSIDQVNTLLDQLAVKSISTPDRIALFNQIFLLSPLEQKWFIRIILLDLRIGLTGESILKAYHQDASYEFKCTGQLENTVNMFIDPSNRSISVFFSNLDYRYIEIL